MGFCYLFSKNDIFKRSLNSLNQYYLIFLSRISTCFILYALCDIFIHTYEIKRTFCEKDIFLIVLPPLVFSIDLAKMLPFPTFTSFPTILNLSVCQIGALKSYKCVKSHSINTYALYIQYTYIIYIVQRNDRRYQYIHL